MNLHDIAGLQSIPSDSNDKDAAAMLVVQTIEADSKSFVNDHQHGVDDVTYQQPIKDDDETFYI